MGYRKRFQSLVLALAMCASLLPAMGAEKEGQEFADPIQDGLTTFVLHGMGLLRVRLFFKVYVAALYLGENEAAKEVLDDTPKRLEIAYLRPISSKIIIDAAEASFKRYLTPQELDDLRPRIDQINALYKDVKEGDRYVLTYLPGEGCELALNGKSLGTIPGADFSSAYFGIWLHEKCLNPDLRKALLNSKP